MCFSNWFRYKFLVYIKTIPHALRASLYYFVVGYENYAMFIDDERLPAKKVAKPMVIVRSSKQAIAFMKRHGCPKYISFDHDLGGDDTSMFIINWMIGQDLDNPRWLHDGFLYYVHSQNVVGVINIHSALQSYKKHKAKMLADQEI